MRNRTQAGRRDVAAGKNGEHAVRRQRRARVDPDDPRMGVGRAHHMRVDLPRQIAVVAEATLA